MEYAIMVAAIERGYTSRTLKDDCVLHSQLFDLFKSKDLRPSRSDFLHMAMLFRDMFRLIP